MMKAMVLAAVLLAAGCTNQSWTVCEHPENNPGACREHWSGRMQWSASQREEAVALLVRRCTRSQTIAACRPGSEAAGASCSFGCQELKVVCSELKDRNACEEACALMPDYCCDAGIQVACLESENRAWQRRVRSLELEDREDDRARIQRETLQARDPSTSNGRLVELATRSERAIWEPAAERVLPMAQDPATPPAWLSRLVHAQDSRLRSAVAGNPAVPEQAALTLCDAGSEVRSILARNPSLARTQCECLDFCRQLERVRLEAQNARQAAAMQRESECLFYERVIGGTCVPDARDTPYDETEPRRDVPACTSLCIREGMDALGK
jgi:hypothetical protein